MRVNLIIFEKTARTEALSFAKFIKHYHSYSSLPENFNKKEYYINKYMNFKCVDVAFEFLILVSSILKDQEEETDRYMKEKLSSLLKTVKEKGKIEQFPSGGNLSFMDYFQPENSYSNVEIVMGIEDNDLLFAVSAIHKVSSTDMNGHEYLVYPEFLGVFNLVYSYIEEMIFFEKPFKKVAVLSLEDFCNSF